MRSREEIIDAVASISFDGPKLLVEMLLDIREHMATMVHHLSFDEARRTHEKLRTMTPLDQANGATIEVSLSQWQALNRDRDVWQGRAEAIGRVLERSDAEALKLEERAEAAEARATSLETQLAEAMAQREEALRWLEAGREELRAAGVKVAEALAARDGAFSARDSLAKMQAVAQAERDEARVERDALNDRLAEAHAAITMLSTSAALHGITAEGIDAARERAEARKQAQAEPDLSYLTEGQIAILRGIGWEPRGRGEKAQPGDTGWWAVPESQTIATPAGGGWDPSFARHLLAGHHDDSGSGQRLVWMYRRVFP